jgi:hypothetical protein
VTGRDRDSSFSAGEGPPPEGLEPDICVHIFTASAGLVGVCLTVIGLIRVILASNPIDTLVDDLLALDAAFFLGSCLLSYWALRTRTLRRMHKVEKFADTVFLLGLSLMVLVCGFITYAIV